MRKIVGIVGIFVFPPAAVAGLVEFGSTANACVDIAREGVAALEERQGPLPPGNEPVMLPVTPTSDAIGRAFENLDRGIRNLLGGER